jgi:hypothetical protein
MLKKPDIQTLLVYRMVDDRIINPSALFKGSYITFFCWTGVIVHDLKCD